MKKFARSAAVIVAVIAVVVLLPASALAFSDVPLGHKYGEAIEALSTVGIINGYPDGTFRPDEPVLRAQFAKMAAGIFRLKVTEDLTSPFQDLGPDDASLYPHEFVAAAANAGIIQGYDASTFGTYDEVSRAQVITMGIRGLENLFSGGLEAPPVYYNGTWGNFHSIHGPYARVAEWNHLLWGIVSWDLDAQPWDAMPRGEVAQFLFAMLDDDLVPVVELAAGWGEWNQLAGLRIKVSEPVVDAGDGSFDEPEAGKKLLAVQITIENVASAARDFNVYQFSLRDTNGYTYDPNHWGSHLSEIISAGTLQPGQKASGWRVFEVPQVAEADAVLFGVYTMDYVVLAWR